MKRFFVPLALILLAQGANAETCPDKYRFVDFGLEDRAGTLRKGGTILRAFDTENTHLLKRESVICHEVEENGIDGRALKIPVVSNAALDVSIANISFSKFRFFTTTDAVQVGENNAAAHRLALTKTETKIAKGEDFLCARDVDATATSCQVRSPFASNAPLVIYCDTEHCAMPALALNDRVVIDAAWPAETTDINALGAEIMQKLRELQLFLKPQISE